MLKKRTVIALIIVIAVTTVIAAADSNDDSLITKGYVDNVLLPQMQSMAGAGEQYSIVSLDSGDKLICEAGCEFIIRMGSGKIIATSKGGICDATDGVDLTNGLAAPSNHHLIVPVGDGRGVVAITDMLIMIKGRYDIK